MKLVSVLCLILCVFLVSQNMENRKQLTVIGNHINRLEKNMQSHDSVNVLKADALLAKAAGSLDAKDTAKAREYIRQARAELGKSAPADMKAPEGDATGVLADTARDFLKNTLKKLME
ncbi:MAG: hypothetical protein IJT95_03280 [Abditibacteriota bacterium]|nr:hypothetical protein [Abditibacteriota bacterium]